MRTLALAVGIASILACLLAPYGYFEGRLPQDAMKTIFFVSSLIWFAAASYWSSR